MISITGEISVCRSFNEITTIDFVCRAGWLSVLTFRKSLDVVKFKWECICQFLAYIEVLDSVRKSQDTCQ